MQVWDQLAEQIDALRRVVGFSGPLTSLPGWMAPGLALGALFALALAAGIALASLGALLTALLIAWTATAVILYFASAVARVLHQNGLIAIERLMGMVLITVAMEMLMSGIRLYLRS